MNPQDDPEARIRDLERPLADQARTSELGAGQYGGDYVNAPPPPPPGYYGPPSQGAPFQTAPFQTAPYQGAPYQGAPRSSGGFAWWWLAVATLVIGGVVVGVGMVVLDGSVFSTGDSTSSSARDRPKVNGGGGTLTAVPPSPVEIPSGNVAVPTEEPAVIVLAPGEPINIGGMGENKTIACNESIVSVSGMDNTITITGHCTNLSVSGMDNEILIESADAIGASGVDNRVTFRSGSPEISKSGFGNVVEPG
jgi:hypothetical protein